MSALSKIIEKFKEELSDSYEPRELNQMVQIIFEQEFDVSLVELLTNNSRVLNPSETNRLNDIKLQLLEMKPLAQILGQWEFCGLPMHVNEHTLIPRPETEELVALVLNENQAKGLKVLDIGTGTGCIPIALKHKRKDWELYGFDVSHKALKLAVQNGLLNQTEVHWEEFDVLKGRKMNYEQQFDIIISNPPYIPSSEKKTMDKSVIDFEPELALFVPAEEPLLFYAAILDFAQLNLKNSGMIYFEVHHGMAKDVVELMNERGFDQSAITQDVNGKDRIVQGRLVN